MASDGNAGPRVRNPPSESSTTDGEDVVCVVCCHNLTIYAIGHCEHPICFVCSTRLRVLCRQNECAICRVQLSRVFFCKSLKRFTELMPMLPLQPFDREYCISFEDSSVITAFESLLEHKCPQCPRRNGFRSFDQLNTHVKRDHRLFYCDICIEHLKLFTYERQLYSRTDLAQHRLSGDPDDKSHKGHPLCEFCDERFFDPDHLYRHLLREHYHCHICDADGLRKFFNDYTMLRQHFIHWHHFCEEGPCKEHQFMVFRTDIDLKAHIATAHSQNKTRSQTKQARTLDLGFSMKPRPHLSYRERHAVDVGCRTNAVGVNNEIPSTVRTLEPGNEELSHVMDGTSSAFTSDRYRPSGPSIDTTSAQEFPSLGPSTSADIRTSDPDKSAKSRSTLARVIAKMNKMNVIDDDDFPELSAPPFTHPGEMCNIRPRGPEPTWKQNPGPQTSCVKKPDGSMRFGLPPEMQENVSLFPPQTNPKQPISNPKVNSDSSRVVNGHSEELLSNGESDKGWVVLKKKDKSNCFSSDSQKGISIHSTLDFPSLESRPQKSFNAPSLASQFGAWSGVKEPTKTSGKQKKKNIKKDLADLCSKRPTPSPASGDGLYSDEAVVNSYRNPASVSAGDRVPSQMEIPKESDFPPLAPLRSMPKPVKSLKPQEDKLDRPPVSTLTLASIASSIVSKAEPTTSQTGARSKIKDVPNDGAGATPVYISPEDFTRRSQELMCHLKQILWDPTRETSEFDEFKRLSGMFRRTEMDGNEYVKKCVALMGSENFSAIFPELVLLLPDIDRQLDLLFTYCSQFGEGGIDLALCPECQQVLDARDSEAHLGTHGLPASALKDLGAFSSE